MLQTRIYSYPGHSINTTNHDREPSSTLGVEYGFGPAHSFNVMRFGQNTPPVSPLITPFSRTERAMPNIRPCPITPVVSPHLPAVASPWDRENPRISAVEVSSLAAQRFVGRPAARILIRPEP